MGSYQEYYDILNLGKKDYAGEISKLYEIYKSISSHPLNKILEVGCGTGNHTNELLKISEKVFACDIDSEMIEIAKRKLTGKNVSFHCSSVPNVPEKDFPLCVLMWNVINYFPGVKEVHDVFKEISDRMLPGGIVFFDMWNGVATIRDPPGNSISRVEKDGLKILHTLEGKTDLMKQRTDILNTIEVLKDGKLFDSFSENVAHYLWTFRMVEDILRENGIEVLKFVKANNYDLDANENDWKIMVIAQKKKNGFL